MSFPSGPMRYLAEIPVGAVSKVSAGVWVVLLAACAEKAPALAGSVSSSESRETAGKPATIPIGTVEKGRYEGIAMDEFFALQQSGGALVYDVRVPYFYGIDHIPGAVNWPHTEYDQQVGRRHVEIRKAKEAGKEVVLYCFNFGCPEARNVAKKLTRRGFDLLVFSSGIDTWREAGLPLEKPTAGTTD